MFVLTLIAEHLSGWAEEWVLWSTQEFGFLALPDAICTGSSIMPQKKNPDVLELIRGRSARVIGALTTLLVLIKGLPLAYNRDLQEDKEPLFDAFDTVEACLEPGRRGRRRREPPRRPDRRAARRGVPRRHDLDGIPDPARASPSAPPTRSIGRLVGLCESRGLKRLADLTDAELAEAHPGLGAGVRESLGVANAVKAFRSYGSTAPEEVERQLARWKGLLKMFTRDLDRGGSRAIGRRMSNDPRRHQPGRQRR